MFKFLVSVIVVLATSSAMAALKVGDYAKQAGTILDENSGQMVPYWNSSELIAFDSVSDTFTVRFIENMDGQVIRNWEYKQKPTEIDASYDVAQCAADGGTVEVVTVAAGSFTTCRFQYDPSYELLDWLGSVPFSLVKSDYPGEYFLELVEYRLGN